MTRQCPVCDSALDENANVCPQCGFKLVEATQQFKPIVLDDADFSQTESAIEQHAVLQVVRGPQIGVAFNLGNTELSVGRSPECDIFLNDMTVSRSHANIAPLGNQYQIEDNNSYNGVWVNNTNVSKCVLKNGDVIQIGAFSLIFKQH